MNHIDVDSMLKFPDEISNVIITSKPGFDGAMKCYTMMCHTALRISKKYSDSNVYIFTLNSFQISVELSDKIKRMHDGTLPPNLKCVTVQTSEYKMAKPGDFVIINDIDKFGTSFEKFYNHRWSQDGVKFLFVRQRAN